MIRAWDRFWFSRVRTDALGVFRIALGLFILHLLAISFPNWLRFYGSNATMPLWLLREEGNAMWSLFAWNSSPGFHWILFVVAITACIYFILGLFTTVSTFVLLVCYASMVTRNTWMVNGQDQVVHLLLFLSCFAPLGSALSLDNRRLGLPALGNERTIWAWRLMQVSIAGIYLFCGPTKLLHWHDGLALYYTSHSYMWFRFPEVDIFHLTSLSYIGTFGTIFLETAFPLFVWFSKLRLPLVIAMMLLHTGIMICLSPAVFHFNLIMLVALLLFLKCEDIDRLRGIKPAPKRQHIK